MIDETSCFLRTNSRRHNKRSESTVKRGIKAKIDEKYQLHGVEKQEMGKVKKVIRKGQNTLER